MTQAPSPLLPANSATTGNLVVRSQVTPGRPYKEYREDLRRDFWFSCAYCTITESEATTIRFTIDHYEPRRARSDLTDVYDNLMYACDTCNTLKGTKCPPPDARAAGHRFYRPDQDEFDDHFSANGLELTHKTETGRFSISQLELNRLHLRKLRDLRFRIHACHEMVAAGIRALRKFPIDRLPPKVKGRANFLINQAVNVSAQIPADIDQILKDYAHSPLADKDPDASAHAKSRIEHLAKLRALFPGSWLGSGP